MPEHLPSVYETLGLSPSPEGKKLTRMAEVQEKRKGDHRSLDDYNSNATESDRICALNL